MEIKRYNTNGEANDKLGDAMAAAKHVNSGKNKDFYYVKVGTDNRLYRPSENIAGRKLGREAFKFRCVNDNCFKSYVNFLKTGHERLLTAAERHMA